MTKAHILIAALAAGLVHHGGGVFSEEADAIASGKRSVLIPGKSWTCGMPEGIPEPEQGKLVLKASIKLRGLHDVGKTPYGNRKVFVTGDGELLGERIKGAVLPGGLDFQLGFSNGSMEVEQVLVLKTADGRYIYMRSAGTAANSSDVRIVPEFEAPTDSSHAWLNHGRFVGRRVVDEEMKTLELMVYDIESLEPEMGSGDKVSVEKPEGLDGQPWEYRLKAPGEKQGDEMIKELVTLGASQSVGQTKGGGRNIIPITGGTLTGRIKGKVLFGGADYQKMGDGITLDARYLWETEEGEVIIVRNAGAMDSLVPVFEVSCESKYAWLNKGTYLSSPPGLGQGGVTLRFYESSR